MKRWLILGLLSVACFSQGYPNTTVSLSASSLAMGQSIFSSGASYGAPTLDQTLTVSNTGLTNNLWVSAITITGTNAADFKEYDSCGPGNRVSMPPNMGFCDIHVWFKPSLVGAETATLTIVSNDASSPHTVTLTGTGAAATHTYYINPAGNDAHTGLAPGAGSAWQTPQHAEATVVAGDLVCVAAGTRFSLPDITSSPFTWVLSASGSSGLPIAFADCGSTAPGSLPVISGSHSPTALQGLFSVGTIPCTPLGHCVDYFTPLTSPNLFDDAWFGTGLLFPNYGRTPEPINNNKNNMTPQGDTIVCVQGPATCPGGASAQQCANLNAGCPAAGINVVQPVGSSITQCAVLNAIPCPPRSGPSSNNWFASNRLEYKNTDINAGPHLGAIGAIKVKLVDVWTMDTEVVCYHGNVNNPNCLSPINGLSYFVGIPYNLVSGSSAVIAGHTYLYQNDPINATTGNFYLDQCPGCASSVTTPAGTQNLHYFGCDGDISCGGSVINPNTFNVQYSAIPGPCGHVLSGSGVSYRVFDGLVFEMGNFYVFPWGDQESQGQPTICADVSFTNSNNIVWHQAVVQHATGKGMEVLGTSANWFMSDCAWYDTGAGGLFVGAIGSNSDTNSSVPSNGTVANCWAFYTNQQYASGEATAVSHENGHNWTYLHNDCEAPLAGCFGEGHFLNGGVSGGYNAGFIYGNKWLWNQGMGRQDHMSGITVSYCCADYGGSYSAANHSSMCPVPNPSIQPANVQQYCNFEIGYKSHDWGSNFQSITHGADCDYKDQGTTHNYTYQLLLYRCANDALYRNTFSHGGNNPAAQYSYQFNFVGNSIISMAGAAEYSVAQYAFPNNGGVLIFGGNFNIHRTTFENNIFVINSEMGATPYRVPSNLEAVDYSQIPILTAGSGATTNCVITASGGGFSTEPKIWGIVSGGALVNAHLLISGVGGSSIPTWNYSACGFSVNPTLNPTLTGGSIVPGPSVAIDVVQSWVDQSNDWFDIALAPLKFEYCPNSAPDNQNPATACRSFPADYFVFPGPPYPWTTTQGQGNVTLDPGFVCPTYNGCVGGLVAENYLPTNTQMMKAINFTPWDTTYSGRVNTSFVPFWSGAPNLYGTSTTINATTDYDCLEYNPVGGEPGTCTTPYVPTGPFNTLNGTVNGGMIH